MRGGVPPPAGLHLGQEVLDGGEAGHKGSVGTVVAASLEENLLC